MNHSKLSPALLAGYEIFFYMPKNHGHHYTLKTFRELCHDFVILYISNLKEIFPLD